MLKNIIRALRLPFITASILPFIFGSLLAGNRFSFWLFLPGLIAAAATHLSANLINDYADSKSGNDWQDTRFYGFFGGSKLIQEKVFSEKFYLHLSLFFAFLSAASIIALSLILKNIAVIGYYILILLLGWSYSVKPLKLSYRGWGEVVIFILFGPALVEGAYFIQTGIFPDLKSFICALPFGFFTTAILFANEVPDSAVDMEVGKMTWVGLLGAKRAFLIYYLLVFSGFGSIYWAVSAGYIGKIALFSFFLIVPAVKAGRILRQNYADKERLVLSSIVTIVVQNLAGIALILSLVI